MTVTYTSPGGNTPQAQSTQRFYEALRAIQGSSPMAASPEDLQTGQASAQSAQLGLQANQGTNMANAQTQLSQGAGIPDLTKQFGDLSGAFKMWLADQNLAGKYANNQNTNPYANAGLIAAGNGNPYNAPVEAIANSTQVEGAGFTNPSLVTQAMGAPMSATTNMLNLLQTALTNQQGQVDTKTKEYGQNYQGAMDALGKVADMFGTEREKRAAEIKANKKNYQAVNLGNGKIAVFDPETGEIIGGGDGEEEGGTSDQLKTIALNSLDDLEKNASYWTTGGASYFSKVRGTPQYDFAGKVEQVEADIMASTLLEIKEASKTGGAFGNLSDKEGAALKKALGNLDVGQSPEQFKKNVREVRQRILNWENLKAKYNNVENQQSSSSQSSNSGTVVMTGPDGKKWNVPQDKVEKFKQNGYK